MMMISRKPITLATVLINPPVISSLTSGINETAHSYTTENAENTKNPFIEIRSMVIDFDHPLCRLVSNKTLRTNVEAVNIKLAHLKSGFFIRTSAKQMPPMMPMKL
jgi:hypothetical protein